VVPDSVEVVEHEGDFRKVADADDPPAIAGLHVEAVAVAGGRGSGPRFALCASVGVHVLVASVGGCASPLQAEFWEAGVAEVGGDSLRRVVGVQLEDAVGGFGW
jgi:hypothetical protein